MDKYPNLLYFFVLWLSNRITSGGPRYRETCHKMFHITWKIPKMWGYPPIGLGTQITRKRDGRVFNQGQG